MRFIKGGKNRTCGNPPRLGGKEIAFKAAAVKTRMNQYTEFSDGKNSRNQSSSSQTLTSGMPIVGISNQRAKHPI